MENNNLLVIGAGQYGMVAKEIAESMGKFGRIDFLDDHNPVAVGKTSEFTEARFRENTIMVRILSRWASTSMFSCL